MERYNKRRYMLTDGKVFLDGYDIGDAEKMSVKITPNVKPSKALGDRTSHNRWGGYEISVEVTKFKANTWTKDVVLNYINSGKTPEFTVQGTNTDKDSEFYDEFGTETITCLGCVLTGDLTIFELDANSDYAKETLNFKAIDIA